LIAGGSASFGPALRPRPHASVSKGGGCDGWVADRGTAWIWNGEQRDEG